MKKIILSVALIIATFGVAQAKNNEIRRYDVEQIEQKNDTRENDGDSTQYITAYYDINRIVIKNNQREQIKIYNSSWELITETNGDVNINLVPGNYYIKTRKKIIAHYACGD